MASLSCGYKCLQILLVIFNIIVFACGVALIVVGSLAIVNFDKYAETTDSTLRGFIIVIICLGCVLFLLGFLGFCGACKKNVCKLTLYSILLGLIVLAEIACGIAGFVLRDKVESLVKKGWTNALQQYKKNPELTKAIDEIQKELKCCGITSSADYQALSLGEVPASCKENGQTFSQGCFTAIKDSVKKYMVIIGIFVFVFALLQIICMVMAICVLQAIKRNEAE